MIRCFFGVGVFVWLSVLGGFDEALVVWICWGYILKKEKRFGVDSFVRRVEVICSIVVLRLFGMLAVGGWSAGISLGARLIDFLR
jgi:hypothetical protein